MDGIACKLPGIISPLLNRAPEAATPPHTIQNMTQISERVKKPQLRLLSAEKEWTDVKELRASSARSLKVASSYTWTQS